MDGLLARKHITQVCIVKLAGNVLIGLVITETALMTVDSMRTYDVSLFAFTGVASLTIGLAARPPLADLIAGVQVVVTQPIRLEDAVIVEGRWDWVEITRTQVVVGYGAGAG